MQIKSESDLELILYQVFVFISFQSQTFFFPSLQHSKYNFLE